MLCDDNRIKICDFDSLLRIPQGEDSVYKSGDGIIGSPGYMSPSIFKQDKAQKCHTDDGIRCTFADDMYSLGVTIGRITNVLTRYKDGVLKTDSTWSKSQHAAYKLCLECMKEDASERPTAEKLLEMIQEALNKSHSAVIKP